MFLTSFLWYSLTTLLKIKGFKPFAANVPRAVKPVN